MRNRCVLCYSQKNGGIRVSNLNQISKLSDQEALEILQNTSKQFEKYLQLTQTTAFVLPIKSENIKPQDWTYPAGLSFIDNK